jgi:hypothetical protein
MFEQGLEIPNPAQPGNVTLETGHEITGTKEKTPSKQTFREKNSEAGNQQYCEEDHWRNTGEIFIKDDHLCFLPQNEIARVHDVFENQYSADGSTLIDRHRYIVEVDKKRVD